MSDVLKLAFWKCHSGFREMRLRAKTLKAGKTAGHGAVKRISVSLLQNPGSPDNRPKLLKYYNIYHPVLFFFNIPAECHF